jgi:transcriptional regulator with XRE-family HTH domain
MAEERFTPFGRLMKAGMTRKGVTQRRLGRMLSVDPEGPIYDATTIRMIQQGDRRLTHELVAMIVELLELDWAEAWAASGLLPPDVSAADLEIIQARRRRRSDREVDLATASSVSGQASSGQEDSFRGTYSVPAGSGVAGFAAA